MGEAVGHKAAVAAQNRGAQAGKVTAEESTPGGSKSRTTDTWAGHSCQSKAGKDFTSR